MNIDKYRKSILVGIMAFLYAVQAAITDGQLSAPEAIGIVLAVATALGVYTVPNGE